MRRRLGWAIVLTAGTILAGAASAGAQDTSVEAQARFSEGLKAYKAGNYEQARLNFLQSDALIHRGSVLRNLALAEMQLGRPLDALQHLRSALSLSDFDAERRRTAERDLRDAYAATGHIAIDAPASARLTLDAQALEGVAPFKDPLDVMPGEHMLEVQVGTETARLKVHAPAGVVVTATFQVEEPVPASKPPVTVLAPPFVGPAPSASSTSTADSPAPAHPFWNSRREIGVGTAALGLMAITVGAYFDIQGNDAQNRASGAVAGLSPWACAGATQPAGCGTARDAWSAQDTDATLTRVFYGIGAAGLLGGAIVFFWPDSSTSRTAIAPLVTPRGSGLQVRGEF